MWKRRLSAIVAGAVIVLLLTLLRASDPYPLRVAREATFDFFQQIQPREAVQLPIRIIDIDEASLASVGQWPWSRRTMAEIARRLTELGAAVVAFDVLFPEPDRLSPSTIVAGGEDYDAEFAAALAAGPSVLSLSENAGGAASTVAPKAGVAITGEDPTKRLPVLAGAAMPLPVLVEAASGLGVASLGKDGSGVARRLPLLWSTDAGLMPTLAVEALRVAQGASTLVLLGDTIGAGTVEALRIGDFTVPTGPSGDLWLYYRTLPQEMYVPALMLLADDYAALAPEIAGHIVFIGTSASGLLDIRTNALGDAVPGVSIHVQALEQMLTGRYLNRADWVGGLEAAVFVVTGLAITLAIVLTGPLIGLLVSLVIAALTVAGSWLAFSQFGLLIDPSFALLGALLVYAAMAFFQFAVTDADKRRIRRAFAHYVAPAVLAEIESNADKLKLGGDVRELTVMFCDVRNYSAIAERTGPADLVRLLNMLFAALGAAITRQRGTIDKFMGDAVMAFWNAPLDVDRHALHACIAALDMREALRAHNEGNARAGVAPVHIGIGIATGPALVGNMGFEQRFDYSCVGDTVNVASRIEGACRLVGYDILVTAETRAAAPELAMLEAGAIALKGMSERETVYLLVGRGGLAGFDELAEAHEELIMALRAGEGAEVELARCRELAEAVEPGLAGFYAAVEGRLGDFVGPVE